MRVLFDLVDPGANIVKSLTIGDIVDNNDSLCASVVGSGQSSEPFLASSVPNLKLDHVVLVFHCLKLEVDANCIEKVLIERILSVAKK